MTAAEPAAVEVRDSRLAYRDGRGTVSAMLHNPGSQPVSLARAVVTAEDAMDLAAHLPRRPGAPDRFPGRRRESPATARPGDRPEAACR